MSLNALSEMIAFPHNFSQAYLQSTESRSITIYQEPKMEGRNGLEFPMENYCNFIGRYICYVAPVTTSAKQLKTTSNKAGNDSICLQSILLHEGQRKYFPWARLKLRRRQFQLNFVLRNVKKENNETLSRHCLLV